MKILVTGAAGFIGFNFCNLLLADKKNRIVGIDNLNDYYDVKLKKKRISILKKHKNYKFIKTDINNNLSLQKIFKKYKFDFVLNLAAQAGVRYSIEHPRKYLESNIVGFYNIIENSSKYKIKRLFYASSSSIYGENKNYPLKETDTIFPKNIYALSKKINEEISYIFNRYYKLKTTGLRFFTVYGEWGRPDMFMMKLFKSHMTNKIFYLNNYGNHLRDFTYIGDVVKAVSKLIKKNFKGHEIFNICSNNPVNIYDVVKDFNKKNPVKVKLTKIHKADILKTHGSNKKLTKNLSKIKYSDFYDTFYQTFEWYKKNKINKL